MDRIGRARQQAPSQTSQASAVRPAAPLAASVSPFAPDQLPRQPVQTEGVGKNWLSFLPAPLRFATAAVLGGAKKVFDWAKGLVGDKPVAKLIPNNPKDRALAAWGSLEDKYGLPGTPGFFAESIGGLKPATVWPHGQAIAAALDVAQLTGDYTHVDATMKALSGYQAGNAYGPAVYTWGAKRLWDDNAWIGLDFLQAYSQTGNKDYLAHAEALFPFMQAGLHKDGGVYWEERNNKPSRNTCANAPAIQMAIKLFQATGKAEYKAYAENLHGFMTQSLRSPEGLYYDAVGDDGVVNKTFWSYNQGAAIGAEIGMYQMTGDPRALARAKQTADAALKHFAGDGFWKQPPAFNAIFFRNLLVLDTIAPDPRYRQAMQTYVDRIWKEGRDPATGALNQGGIGHYGDSGLLDESALIQMTALLGWPPERLRSVS